MTTKQVHDVGRIAVLAASVLVGACSRDAGTAPPSAGSSSLLSDRDAVASGAAYQAVYLVADADGFNAQRLDPNLVNGWGLAMTKSTLWVSSNEPGLAVNYDGHGNQIHTPIAIPSRTSASGGAPSGVVVNGTRAFVLGNGRPAQLLFAGEDGTIAAWNDGAAAVRVAVSASSDAVYKGLAIAPVAARTFLYATDFRGSKIDVYDENFAPVGSPPFKAQPFVDHGSPRIPPDYGPFGIAYLHGKLFVTYAKHLPPDNKDDFPGPGHGFVSVFNPDGSFVARFASYGPLNSPWGIAPSGPAFGRFSNTLLINNFGDGHINAFTPSRLFVGQLQGSDGNPLVIDGIWSVAFPAATSLLVPNVLYFAAGPNQEGHGTFGYIQVQP